jgi:hypothetical protein
MINVATKIAHLTSDELNGDYEIKAVNPDGTILLAELDLSIEAMRKRQGVEPISNETFEELFGDLPTGPA